MSAWCITIVVLTRLSLWASVLLRRFRVTGSYRDATIDQVSVAPLMGVVIDLFNVMGAQKINCISFVHVHSSSRVSFLTHTAKTICVIITLSRALACLINELTQYYLYNVFATCFTPQLFMCCLEYVRSLLGFKRKFKTHAFPNINVSLYHTILYYTILYYTIPYYSSSIW